MPRCGQPQGDPTVMMPTYCRASGAEFTRSRHQRNPPQQSSGKHVSGALQAIHSILAGEDDRLVVIIGPCSITDSDSALESARRLSVLRCRLGGELEIIMRVYFEKPRTTVGWKGLINDPNLDGTFDIDRGLRVARRLLLAVGNLGVPAGSEFLDTSTPQYIADLVAWAAIGARTTESQVHREMASGLSCPVGFKNGTGGNVQIAVDAVLSASQPHHFMAITKGGRSAIATTAGNPDCHIILRGGNTPNYDTASVNAASLVAGRAGIRSAIMIDASHGNSEKDPDKQPLVIEDASRQIERGDRRIIGVMVESNLLSGRQELIAGKPLVYGRSITDACIGWESSVTVLERLARAAERRRRNVVPCALVRDE